MKLTSQNRVGRLRDAIVSYTALFGSMSTLLCCALPALLVSLGFGAVMAGLASGVPGLIWVSENKATVFIASAVMLGINGILMWFTRNAPCPVDPKLRESCLKGRRSSRIVYGISLSLFALGAFFAYVAPQIF